MQCAMRVNFLTRMSHHVTARHRASLVCATWRTAAQKRLFCQVSLKTTEDLQWLGLKKSEDILSSCKILVLCLYDSTISPKRRIDSHALSVFLPLFKTVQQLFIETHKREDDPDLANFIRECTMVQVLLVWHALADEEYDSESEGSQSSCWSAIDEYVTSSIATFPSLMSEALPSLTSLRHFAAIRIDLRASRDAVNPHQPGLANLALLQSYLSTTVLKHLMHDRRW